MTRRRRAVPSGAHPDLHVAGPRPPPPDAPARPCRARAPGTTSSWPPARRWRPRLAAAASIRGTSARAEPRQTPRSARSSPTSPPSSRPHGCRRSSPASSAPPLSAGPRTSCRGRWPGGPTWWSTRSPSWPAPSPLNAAARGGSSTASGRCRPRRGRGSVPASPSCATRGRAVTRRGHPRLAVRRTVPAVAPARRGRCLPPPRADAPRRRRRHAGRAPAVERR